MKTVERIAEVRGICDAARAAGKSVGFVPTMGAFHDGHLSLMRAARGAHDVVVVSLFVNPTQFAAGEDLDAYPRDPAGDARAAEGAGVDVLFTPSTDEMYPEPLLTTVNVAELTDVLCGASRPGHFSGVATVVAKLFSIVGPCTAYFGNKDFQQVTIVRRMVADLNVPVDVVGCPIVRESDGVAMSSRNQYLTAEERAAAPVARPSAPPRRRGARRPVCAMPSRFARRSPTSSTGKRWQRSTTSRSSAPGTSRPSSTLSTGTSSCSRSQPSSARRD